MDKKNIIKILQEEAQQTKQLIATYKQITKPVAPDNSIGRVSRMDAIINNSITESVLRKAEKKINTLEYLLSKKDNKDFGLCAKCKNPIPSQRIMCVPESPYCVHCAK